MSHLYGFFPSWMVAVCTLKLVFPENDLPHILHLNGIFPSCTDKEWLFKLVSLVKWESQISHLKDFLIDFSILNNLFLSTSHHHGFVLLSGYRKWFQIKVLFVIVKKTFIKNHSTSHVHISVLGLEIIWNELPNTVGILMTLSTWKDVGYFWLTFTFKVENLI